MARIIVPNVQDYIPAIQEEISRNQGGRYMHRLHVILFVLQGNSCPQAAHIFGDATRTIEYWLHRLISNGLNGLKDKPIPGRQSQLSPDQFEQLRGEISKSPRELGYDQNIWTGALLSHHLAANYAVKIDVRQCQRIFHQIGFSLQRPRRKAHEADLSKQAEFKKNTRRWWQTRMPRSGARMKSILGVTPR